MSVGFYFPNKSGATAQFVPVRQPVFPAVEPVDYPQQITAESAGGTLYVQDKGTQQQNFELRFEHIPTSDRDAALAFFTTVRKAFQPFEYEDRNGDLHTVRWMNAFDFSLVAHGRWSGRIALRKETIT